jgi:hypothetical protein
MPFIPPPLLSEVPLEPRQAYTATYLGILKLGLFASEIQGIRWLQRIESPFYSHKSYKDVLLKHRGTGPFLSFKTRRK